MIDPDLITTLRVGELPPSAFSLTDKLPHEVGTDLTYGTIQQLIDFISPLVSAIQFQVITLHVNSAYITANFDVTGLGINLMDGYAICNGNNGTLNKDGRTGIAYGSTYNVIGQFGGEENHLLTIGEMPVHSHDINMVGYNLVTGGGAEYVVRTDGTQVPKATNTKGSGQAHNNMMPYIVELQVMKL